MEILIGEADAAKAAAVVHADGRIEIFDPRFMLDNPLMMRAALVAAAKARLSAGQHPAKDGT